MSNRRRLALGLSVAAAWGGVTGGALADSIAARGVEQGVAESVTGSFIAAPMLGILTVGGRRVIVTAPPVRSGQGHASNG